MADPAEPAATSYDAGTAARLGDELISRPSRLARSRLVALDGPAGSGKTSLAKELTHHLAEHGHDVETVSLDDMYDGWAGLDPSLEERVVEQVLLPLTQGSAARWQAYDWAAEAFVRWHVLTPPDVLVLEGCGAGARAYTSYTTLLVWVEAAPDTRLARVVARDGQQVVDHLTAWTRAEQRHFTVNDTAARADLVVET